MGYKFTDNIQRGILFLSKENKDFYLQTANLIKAEYFEFPIHQKIFQSLCTYHNKYNELPKDDILLEECKKLAKNESQDDFNDEILNINNIKDLTENYEYYLDLIESFAKKEAMKNAIEESIGLLKTDRLDEIESKVRKALSISRVVDLGCNYFEDSTERWRRVLEQGMNEFRTLFPSLDKELDGGTARGEMGMVIAPAGRGKSLYLSNQGKVSLLQGKKVLYASFEMGVNKIAQRFDSLLTLIPQNKLKSDVLNISSRLKIFKDNFIGCNLRIKQFSPVVHNVNTIKAYLSQLKNYEGFVPDVIIIDYLELVGPTHTNVMPHQIQELISREIYSLGKEENVAIWTATQSNRKGAEANIITDVELADCYGKIRPPDLVFSLNQDEEEYDSGKMRCYIIKARNAKRGYIIPMKVNYNTLEMSEDTCTQEIEPAKRDTVAQVVKNLSESPLGLNISAIGQQP